MSLSRRVIVCLDVRDGRVVKGVQFEGLRGVGDPVELAARYERDGADEIVFLDIGATHEARDTMLDLARRTAERLFIPLTIGGGIRTVDDMANALRAGADKIGVNSAAVQRPEIMTEGARRFGAQCIVASIDARRDGNSWRVYTSGARVRTELDAIDWARECASRGAGEILLTSIDRDGARTGYDVELTRAVSDAVDVPVIASGGAGSAAHIRDVIVNGGADAALVAGIVHDGVATIAGLKRVMREANIPVRMVA
jgi:cyclase